MAKYEPKVGEKFLAVIMKDLSIEGIVRCKLVDKTTINFDLRLLKTKTGKQKKYLEEGEVLLFNLQKDGTFICEYAQDELECIEVIGIDLQNNFILSNGKLMRNNFIRNYTSLEIINLVGADEGGRYLGKKLFVYIYEDVVVDYSYKPGKKFNDLRYTMNEINSFNGVCKSGPYDILNLAYELDSHRKYLKNTKETKLF